jgi:hypothetical protein
MKINILSVVHDPGATKALMPVLRILNNEPTIRLKVLASTLAAPWLLQNNIAVDHVGSNCSSAEVSEVYRNLEPSALLTGTSWASTTEQVFRNQAAAHGIPSVVVIDYWMNYRARFIGADYPVEQTPDFICVADVAMAKEAVAQGFPESQVVISGHPHLEDLRQARSPRNPGRSPALDAAIFLSEPLPDGGLNPVKKHPLLVCATAFSDWLVRKNASEGIFSLKLHPKEVGNPRLDLAIAEVEKLPRLRFNLMDQQASVLGVLSSYQWAFGYKSMALFESSAAGLKTISLPMVDRKEFPALFDAMAKHGIFFSDNVPEFVLRLMIELEKNAIATATIGGDAKAAPLIFELIRKLGAGVPSTQ